MKSVTSRCVTNVVVVVVWATNCVCVFLINVRSTKKTACIILMFC